MGRLLVIKKNGDELEDLLLISLDKLPDGTHNYLGELHVEGGPYLHLTKMDLKWLRRQIDLILTEE